MSQREALPILAPEFWLLNSSFFPVLILYE
jgi:hypothetical protein